MTAWVDPDPKDLPAWWLARSPEITDTGDDSTWILARSEDHRSPLPRTKQEYLLSVGLSQLVELNQEALGVSGDLDELGVRKVPHHAPSRHGAVGLSPAFVCGGLRYNMTPPSLHVEPFRVPDVCFKPANISLSSVVLSKKILRSSSPPSAWLLQSSNTIVDIGSSAAFISLINMTLSQSPGQPLGIVTDCPSPHPPAHLLTGQLAGGSTFTDFITEKLDLRTPAGQEPTNLQLAWQVGTLSSRSSFHFYHFIKYNLEV